MPRRPTDSTASVEQLQRILDSLYDQTSVLGHGLLALRRADASESVARSIAHQILHLATHGVVRVVDDRTIQPASDPGSEDLRPDERLLLRLLFTDRVDRIPVRTAAPTRRRSSRPGPTWSTG